MKSQGHLRVKEKRTALGRDEVEQIIHDLAAKRLDVVDEHFRGRAVSFLESARPGVRIRVLMAPDPAWSKTVRALRELEAGLRGRIEVREWPETEKNPVPWHVRFMVGDRGAWEISHSLDGVGKKATYFTDKSQARQELAADFERWWTGSRVVFPSS